MGLYYIDIARHEERIRVLSEACQKAGVDFLLIDPDQFDYVQAPQLKAGDFLYRGVAKHDSFAAPMVEKQLLTAEAITFYQTYQRALSGWSVNSLILNSKIGVPTPRAVWGLSRNADQLRRSVEHVGGFPVVVKVLGGSKGKGVMKVDSWHGLVSLTDYLLANQREVVLQEFIDVGLPAHSCRAIVLGNEVRWAYTLMQSDADDFRSNSGQRRRTREMITLSEADAALIVKAVQAAGVELGAVDFVRAGNGGGIVVFEVNFPFNFARAALQLKIDIPGAMIDFLQKKAATHVAQ